jgi:hypothetical protein
MSCPICSAETIKSILRRERLPIMQNVSYPTRALALASPCAPFELTGCTRCGFMFNSRFDGTLLTYDEAYDNHVESAAFHDYYESLARTLIGRFGLDAGGVVYDVGCGRGTFLKTLCALAPNIRGIGLDPSCEPMESENLTLLRAKFSSDLISKQAKLILLRHVLEHIDTPLEFLTALRDAAGTVPLFVEVPETSWIFTTGAFWDFCYEHCNYFVVDSLATALRAAGFRVHDQQISFGGQYQWAICSAETVATRQPPPNEISMVRIDAGLRYASTESGYVARATRILTEAGSEGACAIWGMATKGVVLASMLPPELVAGGVDSNVRKQRRFAPGSGLEIHEPLWLGTLPGKVTALVMNRNYLAEIHAQTRDLGLDVNLQAI